MTKPDAAEITAFRDSALRFNRGREHAISLKTTIQEWLISHADAVGIEANPPHGPIVSQDESPPLADWSVVYGDAINDFRSALDYLVYGLSRLDSGTYQEHTQFPLEDSPGRFRKRAPRSLRGLSTEHIAMIEAVQPYRQDAEWAHHLRFLSNADKHRRLSTLVASLSREFQVQGPPSKKPEAGPTEIQYATDVIEGDLNIELELWYGAGAIGVLDAVQTGVYEVMLSFKNDVGFD